MAADANWPARAAFVLAALAVTALALRGGTYDIVARQEAAIAVWWVLGLGYALGLLPRARPHPAVLLPIAELCALGAWTFLSLGWSASDERTLAEGCRIVGYLGLLVLVVSVLDRRTWRAAAAGLAAGALLVAALATASRLAPGLFPSDPVRAIGGSRLSWPFNYWNAVGAWGAMAVTAALAWSVSAVSTRVRAAFLAAAPVAALSIYLAYSRAALAGVAAGVLCLVALGPRRLALAVHLAVGGAATAVAVLVARGEPGVAQGEGGDGGVTVGLVLLVCCAACGATALLTRRAGADDRWRVPARTARRAGVAAAACLLVACVVAGPGLASRAWDEFRESGVQPASPADVAADPAQRLGSLKGSRHAIWSAALDAYREDPLNGSGAGTFEFAWDRSGRGEETFKDAHSLYLEPAAELGWPGALLTLGFLVAVAAVSLEALRRTKRAHARGAAAALVAVLAVFLVQAGFDWMWESTAVAVLGIGGAAMLWARLGEQDARVRLGRLARAAAAAACFLMCLLLVPGLASSSLVRDSQRSVERGDLTQAAAQADDAVASSPWAAGPRTQRGLVAELQGDLRGAREDFRGAARREPQNWRLPLLLARVEARLGRVRAALRQYRLARSLRPEAQIFARPPVTGAVSESAPGP